MIPHRAWPTRMGRQRSRILPAAVRPGPPPPCSPHGPQPPGLFDKVLGERVVRSPGGLILQVHPGLELRIPGKRELRPPMGPQGRQRGTINGVGDLLAPTAVDVEQKLRRVPRDGRTRRPGDACRHEGNRSPRVRGSGAHQQPFLRSGRSPVLEFSPQQSPGPSVQPRSSRPADGHRRCNPHRRTPGQDPWVSAC